MIMVLSIFNILVSILVSIGVIASGIGIIVAVALAISAGSYSDENEKKRLKKYAKRSLLIPVLSTLCIMVIWGLVAIFVHTFG